MNRPEGEIRTWTFDDDKPQQPTGEWRIAMAEQPLKEQDCIVSMESQGVWGIFDGMGGVGDRNAGKVASNLAAKVCRNSYAHESGLGTSLLSETQRMRDWLLNADEVISRQGEMGTTAVAVRLVEENGRPYAVWANVGDSRLYLFRNGTVQQITEDEGYGHYLTNCLGNGNAKVSQVGHLPLQPHDRLMLCSDGITGDYYPDILTDEELEVALSASTPQAAANMLLDTSRKRDDKSVVVIEMPDTGIEVESSSLQEHQLGEYEHYRFDTSKPLELRGNYNVVAQISAADKELLLLDLRPAPMSADKRVPFGESVGQWDADFLLVDESFFGKWGRPIRGQGGYKGIRTGDTLDFGRYHSTDRFELSTKVSRDHFSITHDGNDLYIGNHSPLNGTSIVVKR